MTALPPPPSLSVPERKALGAFYTPHAVVDALVRWAVRRESERILDPSFGDGRFLAAAAVRLGELGVSAPGRRLFGVELEAAAAKSPATLLGIRVPAGQLVHGDFFATDLDRWSGQRFAAIVGNPPYVRHHLLGAASRRLAQRRAARVGVNLSERADSWAYFSAALLDYLEPSGRLAVLLPGALLHAEYALPLLHAFSEVRGHVQLIRIQERLFEGAVERTIVLLIDGRHEQPGVDYRDVEDVAGLDCVLTGRSPQTDASRASVTVSPTSGMTPALRLRARLRWFLGSETADLWERLTELAQVLPLSAVAELRIGVVTGANRFFVVAGEAAARFAGRGVQTVPVVSRGGWLQRTRWTTAEQDAHFERRSRLLLIDPRARLRKALRASIDAAEGEGVHQRSHCRARESWYTLTDWAPPDLFLPYMGSTPPRLVVNLARATCTNAIHRVSLRNGQAGIAAVAAASWTSLYRLSAELVGRSYGGGVLKLELGEAAQLRLALVPGGAEHLAEIEAVASRDGPAAAQQCADELLLSRGLRLADAEIETLRDAAAGLERRRGS